MKKNIIKLVLTGGPCAGKSSALARLIVKLTQIGYKVIIVPEAATELINNGISIGPAGIDPVTFQKTIMKLQLLREHVYEEAARQMAQDNIVLICDRGAIDNQAYCSKGEFAEVVASMSNPQSLKAVVDVLSQSVASISDSYNAVFHMKTAADGAESYYTLENNEARSESPELARELDIKTMDAWTGHSRITIIDNSTDFDTKLNRLTEGVYQFLGQPVPIEIERKFLVKMPDIEKLVSEYRAVKIDILQTYLMSNDTNEETRVRQRGQSGEYTYFFTKKKEISNMSRVETGGVITQHEYIDLLMNADTALKPVRKERYCFVSDNLYFVLDVHPFWRDYAILEIELTRENQEIAFPTFIDVIREVTDDLRFRNRSIAKEIPKID